MDELLGSKPYMSPVATTSSSGKRTLLESTESNTSDESAMDDSQPSKLQLLLHLILFYVLCYIIIIYLLFYSEKARQAHSTEYLLAQLKENRAQTEAAAERRHRENLEIRQRLLTSFENMVDILKNK